MGYTVFILATMLVLPGIAVMVDLRRSKEPLLELIGKWFIFFGVGIRLLVASLMQVFNPGFTADLLQFGDNARVIIQELGFTNLLLATVALVSLWKPNYRVLGTAGAIYMGFAGLLHLANQTSGATMRETVALWSDLWICFVALIYLAYRWAELRQPKRTVPDYNHR